MTFSRLFTRIAPAAPVLAIALAALLALASPQHATAQDSVSFERMGLTIELPAEFGDPVFAFDDEIAWFDEAMRSSRPGIGVILGLAPTRGDVIGDMTQAEGAIHELGKVTFAAGPFERLDFTIPGDDGVAGVMFFSEEPYHQDSIVVLMIATMPDNIDNARSAIEAIAARIEELNSAAD